jgi:hypothetical protein
MNLTTFLASAGACTAVLALTGSPAPAAGALLQADWVIPAGTSLPYDTSTGPATLRYGRVVIEAGASLVVRGTRPFALECSELVVEGELDLRGEDSIGVATLNTTNQPEVGAVGGAAGGQGGTGSAVTNASTPKGRPGAGSLGVGIGGEGGESSYSAQGSHARRAAGGGGGRLAADRPAHPVPSDPSNLGLVATAGKDGSPTGLGAVSQLAPAVGGAAGPAVFSDPDPSNDFWGRMRTPAGFVLGEAQRPSGGHGGGAGGDASNTDDYPAVFSPSGDEKGAGGGGGGGLAVIKARRIVVGAAGRIVADGGDGGGGENTIFFDRIGGGSGAGSGGWLVLQALEIDLSAAQEDALSALGGRGGVGANNVLDAIGAGGNGGPGVIQLHTPDGTASGVLLPAGRTVGDLTTPGAYVLLPL